MYSYDYGYSSGPAIGIIIFMYVFMLAVCVFMIICNWRLFSKASVEGWRALIPVYNTYIMCQLAGLGNMWLVLALVPCTSFIATIYINIKYLQRYDVPMRLCILNIFFPFVITPMVAFSGKYQYIGTGV